MLDTDKLRGYKARSFPTMESSAQKFIADEFQNISVAISQIIAALKALEARIAALE